MNNILNKYIFYVTCWTLNLLENRSHKSKVVFQIWGWYLKKSAFSKILFGRCTKLSTLDASKTLLEHTVVGFVIYSSFISQILQKHTHTIFFYDTHTNHTLTSIPTPIPTPLIHLAPSGKKIVKNNNFEALPTEWNTINKNCIILQLNALIIEVLMGIFLSKRHWVVHFFCT